MSTVCGTKKSCDDGAPHYGGKTTESCDECGGKICLLYVERRKAATDAPHYGGKTTGSCDENMSTLCGTKKSCDDGGKTTESCAENGGKIGLLYVERRKAVAGKYVYCMWEEEKLHVTDAPHMAGKYVYSYSTVSGTKKSESAIFFRKGLSLPFLQAEGKLASSWWPSFE